MTNRFWLVRLVFCSVRCTTVRNCLRLSSCIRTKSQWFEWNVWFISDFEYKTMREKTLKSIRKGEIKWCCLCTKSIGCKWTTFGHFCCFILSVIVASSFCFVNDFTNIISSKCYRSRTGITVFLFLLNIFDFQVVQRCHSLIENGNVLYKTVETINWNSKSFETIDSF